MEIKIYHKGTRKPFTDEDALEILKKSRGFKECDVLFNMWKRDLDGPFINEDGEVLYKGYLEDTFYVTTEVDVEINNNNNRWFTFDEKEPEIGQIIAIVWKGCTLPEVVEYNIHVDFKTLEEYPTFFKDYQQEILFDRWFQLEVTHWMPIPNWEKK